VNFSENWIHLFNFAVNKRCQTCAVEQNILSSSKLLKIANDWLFISFFSLRAISAPIYLQNFIYIHRRQSMLNKKLCKAVCRWIPSYQWSIVSKQTTTLQIIVYFFFVKHLLCFFWWVNKQSEIVRPENVYNKILCWDSLCKDMSPFKNFSFCWVNKQSEISRPENVNNNFMLGQIV
jgi:hypothetical protein